MQPITYKFVMDMDGLIRGVELWQNDQHITISMMAKGTRKNGYRWVEIRDFLDTVKLPVYQDAEQAKRFDRLITRLSEEHTTT